MASNDDTVIPFRTRRSLDPRRFARYRSDPADQTVRRVPIDLRFNERVRVDDTVSHGHFLLALRYAGLNVARDERDGAYVVVRAEDPRLLRKGGRP